MGEDFRLELVTVQPLTRGTGNHSGPTVSSGGSRGGSRMLTIEVPVTIDGRVFGRELSKK